MLVSQPGKRFRLLCGARPSVVIVGEYDDRAQSQAGFGQPSLRRLLRASASATVIGRVTHRDAYALPTAPVVLLGRHAAILATRLARGIPCIEIITRTVSRLPLLISAARMGAA